MNSLIVKIFVFVNEVLSVIILGIGALLTILVGLSKGFLALIACLAILLIFTLCFGFAAMMIENHKLLKDISANTKND